MRHTSKSLKIHEILRRLLNIEQLLLNKICEVKGKEI